MKLIRVKYHVLLGSIMILLRLHFKGKNTSFGLIPMVCV